jgi:hypothetical protein
MSVPRNCRCSEDTSPVSTRCPIAVERFMLAILAEPEPGVDTGAKEAAAELGVLRN